MNPEQEQQIKDLLTQIQAVSGGSYTLTFTPSVPTAVTFTVPPTV